MSDTRFDLVRCENLKEDLFAAGRMNESAVAALFQAYRREIANCYSEIDRLTARCDEWKRDAGKLAKSSVKASCVTRTRETIDGVECERISGLDVVVPVGLIPDGEGIADIRSAKLPFPGRYVGVDGRVYPPSKISLPEDSCELLLMLADKPAPAPVPTWTPPAGFPLVRFISCNVRRAIQILDDSGSRWLDVAYMQKWFPAFDLPPDGSWRVCADDRAAYLGPNQESPQ